jgi:serine/threonine-protein kinase
VWLARQTALDRPVALKILKQRVLEESGALRRFKREAHAASRLTDPHTIKVFDFGASDDGVFYLAMELLDGLDLEQLIAESGPLPPARVIHLARQASASLAEAHAAGIIHCDIKPANVFVARVGSDLDFVKVLDFGLARVLTGPGATTVVDSIRGTPAFMPPEVVRGERVGPESDVYSMGALLYFMLTGTTVFRGLGFHEMVMASLEGVPEPPSKRLGHELPADLERIVLRCLSKDRGVRYATAKELEAALAACELAGTWSSKEALTAWTELRPSLAMKTKR